MSPSPSLPESSNACNGVSEELGGPPPSSAASSACPPQSASPSLFPASSESREEAPVVRCRHLRYSYQVPSRQRPLSTECTDSCQLLPPSGVCLSTEFLDSMALAASSVDAEGTTSAGERGARQGRGEENRGAGGHGEEGREREEAGGQREYQLFDVSLEIPKGARVVVIGSNGAGKSTLLNILGGKMLIPEGMAFVLGRPAFHDVSLGRDVVCLSEWWKGDFALDVPLYDLVGPVVEAHIQEKMEKKRDASLAPDQAECRRPRGFWSRLFYDEGLFSPLPCCSSSSASSPASASAAAGEGERERLGEEECVVSRVRRLVTLLGVDMRWRIARISDGERRRCQLLAALCEPRKVYILDEATSDLDLVSREGLLRLLLHESSRRGATVLYSTHIFDGLDEWATHLLYMRKGRLHLYRPLSELPALEELRRSGHSAPLYALARQWLFEEWQHQPQLLALQRL
ncbi:ABC transporter, ATP-binding domain-containing protein [Toxoplasma gondii MAS]|uniref:ABC transporter, ATP-binding domain-containing protein n=2 Tax=Toxoplasma gondii TaxID=5811 RepID=A0A086Q9S1_TOXGO|nr:ABC transporter, ATP-binding domain-containing protein [Toxoplasma gondii MAS]